ncbi:MAG: hypothetical protein PHT38_01175 [Halothiobacillus sp.]|jgi:hypothetical protein|nr:hypothetical protein [Halothiobacillus sp.]
MLQSVVKSMLPGERVRFEVSQEAKGGLVVVLTPILSGDPDAVPDELKSLRAALCAPLIMRGDSIEQISGEFMTRVGDYTAGRKAGQSVMDELLLSLSEASKQANKAVEKKKDESKTKSAGKKAAATPAPVDDEDDQGEIGCCGDSCPSDESAEITPPAPKVVPANATSLFDI